MFVAMCTHTFKTVKLGDVAEQLSVSKTKNIGPFFIVSSTPKYKGRLNKKCTSYNNIGSISISLTHKKNSKITKCSLLLFENKIRISSGLPVTVRSDVHAKISMEPIEKYTKLILNALEGFTGSLVKPHNNITVVNLQAQYSKQRFIKNYMNACETTFLKNTLYNRVVLPFCFETGAVATCHLYPLPGRKCSAKLHQSGKIQYMGFAEMDMIHVFHTLVLEDINKM